MNKSISDPRSWPFRGGYKALFLIFFLPFTLSSQTEGDERVLSSRVMTLSIQAETPELDSKLYVIDQIKTIFTEGSQGDDTNDLVGILINLAVDGVSNTTYTGTQKALDYPTAREEAAFVLGLTGSELARQPLMEIIKKDIYVGPIISSVESLGQLGPDEEGAVLVVFSWVLKNTRGVFRDELLVRTTLSAIYTMSESDPTILENEGLMEGILFVTDTQMGYTKKTRSIGETLLKKFD